MGHTTPVLAVFFTGSGLLLIIKTGFFGRLAGWNSPPVSRLPLDSPGFAPNCGVSIEEFV
jgi:hypothetical protein